MDRLNADAAADNAAARDGIGRGHKRRRYESLTDGSTLLVELLSLLCMLRSSLWQRAKRVCQTRRKSCIICLCISVVLLVALTSGGTYVYTKTPSDGQSPPWYPTRAYYTHKYGQRGDVVSHI
jgi:hypothetical protein